MNNQAAQKMPELPAPVFFAAPSEGYTAAQMHQHARDYAAALSKTAGAPFGHAMFNAKGACVGFRQNHGFGYNFTVADFLRADKIMPDGAPHTGCLVYAAAPAASGGEDQPVIASDDFNRGWKAGYGYRDKAEPQPPAAASVSERAREILSQAYRDAGFDKAAEWVLQVDLDDELYVLDRAVIRALEQALTQQRGELPSAKTFASAVWRDWMTNEQADKLGAELHAWLGAHVATTPQPGAEALRELVAEWKVRPGVTDAYKICADELETKLESLLARGAK